MPIKHPGEFGVNESFWNKKNVFLTGHSGFKGSWLSIWLNKIGANLFEASMAMGIFAFVAGITTYIFGRFSDSHDPKKIMKRGNTGNFRPQPLLRQL